MKIKDILILAFLTITVGSVYSVAGYATKTFPPIFLYSMRMLISAIITIPFFPFPKEYGAKIFGMATAQAVAFTGIGLAVKNIDSSITALIMRLDIPLTIFFSSLLFQEKVKVNSIIGMLICFYSIYILSGQIEIYNIGYIFILFLSSLGNVATNILSKQMKTINPFAISSWSSAIAFVEMMIISLAFRENIITSVKTASPISWIVLFYLGAITTLVCNSLFYYLLKHYETSKIMSFSFLRPVVSILTGYWILGESITSTKIIGMLLITLGVAIAQMDTKKLLAKFKKQG